MLVAPPARRGLAAALALLALAVLCLSLCAAPARAQSCTTDGSAKVCVAKLKDSCSPGPPYTCRASRNECRFSSGKLVKCEYDSRQRICRGFGGVKCSLSYKTSCTSTDSDKRCRTDSATTCTGKTTQTCKRTVDNCHTFVKRGSFACSFTEVATRCGQTICRTTRTTCKTSTHQGKRCYATFSSGDSAAAGDEDTPVPADSGDDPAPADDGPGGDPGTTSGDGAPPPEQ